MEFFRSMMVTLTLPLLLLGTDADSVTRERQMKKLKLKILYLESKFIDQENEIREKDKKMALLEKSIQQKSTQVASLESEIKLLSTDEDEMVHKANVQNHFLKKQIHTLQIELKTIVGEWEALESKACKAEKTAREAVCQKLEHVTKIKDRQRLKLEQLNRDLKIAQNEIVKLQARANLKAEEIEKARGAWIPHWVMNHVNRLQEILSRYWNKLVRPALKGFIGRIVEKLAYLQELIEPHTELTSNVAYSKTSDVYGICADGITPCFFKIRQTIRMYLQAAYSKSSDLYGTFMDAILPHFSKKVKKPLYIAGEKTASEPHATKVRLMYKHHKKNYLVSMSMKIINGVAVYLKQVQAITYGAFRKLDILWRLLARRLYFLIFGEVI